MKMNIKKGLLVSLAVLLISACNSNNNNPGTNTDTKPNLSGVNIVEAGVSEYKIIYEQDASSAVVAAANELSNFLEEASGVSISYSVDTGEEFDKTQKVISLGSTQIYEQTGLQITSDMGKTGYYLKRFGNTLVINAKDGNGVLNGVYDFLNYTIDLEFYAEDEYTYTKSDTVPLLDFDITHIASIDVRDILSKSLSTQYRRRMRLYTGEGKGQWITFAHTVITTYLPVSTYYNDHPDWYASSLDQVCYSNEEMRHEMARQIEQKIVECPDGQYVMIGHEDNWNTCTCEKCLAEQELYGGYSGQELHFTNEISKEVDAWLADNYPDRHVDYVFFAYQTSQVPPIKTEIVDGKEVAVLDSDGRYIPKYDNFDIRDDVIVIYCPIDADFSKGFSEESNSSQYEQLKGWSDIFYKSNLYNNILIWSYSLAVRDYFVPFNNFGAAKQTYQFYKDLGACYVMDQANHDSGIPCFEAMKIYTESKLMYNLDLDYNTLVTNFMNNYYGAAGSDIEQYLYLIRANYTKNNISGSIWQTLSSKTLWSLETLEYMMSIFDNALEKIEPLRDTDEDRFNVLNSRIRRERLTPIYLLLKLYFTYLTQEQKEEYITDLDIYTKKYDIISTGEGGNDVEALVSEWKSSIFDN